MSNIAMKENIFENSLNDIENKINKTGRKPRTKSFLKYYYKNHEKMLEYKKEANKKYYIKHRNKYHCEICNNHYAILAIAEQHFMTNKHQNAISKLLNKFTIRNTETNEYIM